MSTLAVTENWADGNTLTAAQLSAAMTSIETWANGNVDATNIASGGVEEGNIDTGAVTESKVATSAITTAKVADEAITLPKLAIRTVAATVGVGGFAISDSSGAYSNTGAGFQQVTNLAVTITTTGRPLVLALVPAGTAYESRSKMSIPANNSVYIKFVNTTSNTDVLYYEQLNPTSTADADSAPIVTFSFPAAGTYSYSVYAASANGSEYLIHNYKFAAFELG